MIDTMERTYMVRMSAFIELIYGKTDKEQNYQKQFLKKNRYFITFPSRISKLFRQYYKYSYFFNTEKYRKNYLKTGNAVRFLNCIQVCVVKLIINKIIRNKMQKLNHMSINDILQKRKARILSKKSNVKTVDNHTFSFEEKDSDLVEDILIKIKKLSSHSPIKCDLTQQQKNALVDYISEKQNISYNRSTLSSLITVWKYPDNHQLQLVQENFSFGNLRQSTSVTKNRKSFYILKGKIAIYQKLQNSSSFFQTKKKGKSNFFDEDKKRKESINQEQEISKTQPIKVYEQLSGIGPIFKSREDLKSITPIALDAILIEIKQPEFQNLIINNGGMQNQRKIEILEHFTIFNCLGRKLQNVLPSIELRKFTKNEPIYKIGQVPTAVYLIIKGEVIFDMKIQFPARKRSLPLKSTETPKNLSYETMSIQTQTLGICNYFGEQQILQKNTRTQNAICQSSECSILQIPVIKFQKLLIYSEFMEMIKKAVDIKIEQRQTKIDKAMQVFNKFQTTMEDQQGQNFENDKKQGKGGTASKRKRSSQVRVMHGNVIRKIPNVKNEQDSNFSMLTANPDMYQATLKKFRKLTMKPEAKAKPEVNWKLKRVWKVLNLENVLREDGQVGSPEGKKYFESHRRLQNHVSEVKSLRPKTSSSTYRTKLQYIAYLQQFNT